MYDKNSELKVSDRSDARGNFRFCGNFSTRVSTRNSAKSHVPVETIWTVKCPFYAVLSNFLSQFQRVQDLGSDGMQEVSGPIPLISTKKHRETKGFSVFLFVYKEPRAMPVG